MVDVPLCFWSLASADRSPSPCGKPVCGVNGVAPPIRPPTRNGCAPLPLPRARGSCARGRRGS